MYLCMYVCILGNVATNEDDDNNNNNDDRYFTETK